MTIVYEYLSCTSTASEMMYEYSSCTSMASEIMYEYSSCTSTAPGCMYEYSYSTSTASEIMYFEVRVLVQYEYFRTSVLRHVRIVLMNSLMEVILALAYPPPPDRLMFRTNDTHRAAATELRAHAIHSWYSYKHSWYSYMDEYETLLVRSGIYVRVLVLYEYGLRKHVRVLVLYEYGLRNHVRVLVLYEYGLRNHVRVLVQYEYFRTSASTSTSNE
ncbi:hypothetical protein JKP88DRAFT_248587 [Tribonema minus]|uniref:Uncharacterized protein n=1 Tax=Tribonema minus TaxID=303371 RepID=A0A835YLT6_9STRA|nr:hypothetical protein JKP88DRAFT_248587 [Tribonema minus]